MGNEIKYYARGEHFTFQSGYIQMATGQQLEVRHLPLHSNLVIFKFPCGKST